MMNQPLEDDNLTRLAGKGAFERGLRYFNEGRVTVTESTANRLRAKVEGSADYFVELTLNGDKLSAHCDCPVDGFCKHAVAAALAWRGDAPVKPKTRKESAPDLSAFLKKQSAERLAQLLAKYAHEYDGVRRELTLLARVESARDDPAALDKAVRGFLNVRRFLDYRGSIAYARELDGLIELLRQTLEQNPALCARLCEAAAAKLFRIYENSDDSAGAIGDRFYTLGQIHQRACLAASPPPKELAKRLYPLALEDDWGFFDLAHYKRALGEEGLAAFAAQAQKAWDNLPPLKPGMDRYDGHRWKLRYLLEAWAKEAGDHDYLIALRSRDLTSAHDHIQLVETYRQANRPREALAAAERGMKAFPNDWQLREIAARELRESGMDDEALALLWRNFEQQPSEQFYQKLLSAAGSQRESWRERALEHIRSRERPWGKNGKPDASLRIAILLNENRLEDAIDLASSHTCSLHVLEALAPRTAKTNPSAAVAFYRRMTESTMANHPGNAAYAAVAGYLRCMRPLMAVSEFDAYMADLRQRFRAKRNFIKALDEIGH
jgi:uncharacterized Zn finger protein